MHSAIPVFDGHNDLSMRVENEAGEADLNVFLERSGIGHLDLPRAIEGRFAGGMFAIFVSPQETPAKIESPEKNQTVSSNLQSIDASYAQEVTQRRIILLKKMASAADKPVTLALNVSDIEKAMAERKVAIVIHLEGAEAVAPGLENLETLYEDGVRSIGLVWSRENAFGFGVPFRFPSSPDIGPGLKDAGKDLVRACNRLGIVVDMSHLNEKGFWDVEKISDRPLVASHSCVHAFSPTPRNLTDKQLDAIGASNGIIGINFAVQFLRSDGQKNPDTPLSVMADHFAYTADRIGVEHVGIGSDFDGTLIAKEIGDVTGLPKLIDVLRERGFNEEELQKIAYKNWLRVLAKTWK